MAARLGFACAVHIEPEILLIDEVLSVGDIKFRMKCHQRLAKLRENGTAFMLVSHNPHSIINICTSAVYLAKGQLITAGRTEAVIRRYEEDLCLGGIESAIGQLHLPKKTKETSLGLDIRSLSFKGEHGDILLEPLTGEPANLCIECDSHQALDDANLGFVVKSLSGEQDRVLYLTSAGDNIPLKIAPGRVELQIQMPQLGLAPGIYSAKVYIRQGVRSLDVVESFRFTVRSERTMSRCIFYQPRTWKSIQK
jgi:lipopolysaccharide transport system ATP-binding protein